MGILLQLFISFATVGLFCVGGGYASMPLIQAEVIDIHGWLTMNEFVDIFTLSQMTPGPIGINAATFVGSKVAGIPGSIAATAGFVFPSVFISILSWSLSVDPFSCLLLLLLLLLSHFSRVQLCMTP